VTASKLASKGTSQQEEGERDDTVGERNLRVCVAQERSRAVTEQKRIY